MGQYICLCFVFTCTNFSIKMANYWYRVQKTDWLVTELVRKCCCPQTPECYCWMFCSEIKDKKTGPTQFFLLKREPAASCSIHVKTSIDEKTALIGPLCDAFRNLPDNQRTVQDRDDVSFLQPEKWTTLLAFSVWISHMMTITLKKIKNQRGKCLCVKIISLKLLQGWCVHLKFEYFTLASPHFTSCFRVSVISL